MIKLCDCSGCACHRNPPCSHCTDGHEIEKPYVTWRPSHGGFVITCDACNARFLVITPELSYAMNRAADHVTDHVSAIAGDDCTLCQQPIRDHLYLTPCRELL